MRPFSFALPFALLVALASCARFDAAESAPDASAGGADLTGGDFEGTGPECGADWVGTRGVLSYADGHESKQSCRVCENDATSAGPSLVYLSRTKPLALPRPAGQIRLSAWIRIEGGGTGTGRIQVDARDAAGSSVGPVSFGTAIDLSAQWRESAITLRPPADATSVDVAVAVQIPKAACVQIDDMSLVLTP